MATAKDALNAIESHERECKALYKSIDKRLEDGSKRFDKLDNMIKVKILVGGELKSNKGINLPFVNVSAPSFTEKDREDLLFGLREGVDYVAMSFVRSREDIQKVKSFLHRL